MTGSRFDLIIFDCDGVLIDSEAISSRIEIAAFEELGCSLTRHEYLKLTAGRTEEEEIWRSIASQHGIRLPEGFAERMRKSVEEAFETELRPIEGVKDVLHVIALDKCVASGSRPERLKRVLEISGLNRFFNGNVFSATQVPRGKPHPDLFLFAARKMGVSPSRCVVIEDSPAGAHGALTAGMEVIGFVGAGHCDPAWSRELERAGVENIIDDMRMLPDMLETLR
ncbi:MAG TPA: HAD family hydrolase [Acidobacteriota bacterium]|nr:HAD family hydrolase [Acidobacteriota bacterium]